MTILYFYQYFTTPKGSWSTRVFEFARRWAKKGDKVIVVTSIYDKSDLTCSGISERQIYEGVEVIVLNIRLSTKHGFLRRIASFLWYSILSSFYALTIKCDVVISSSGPITAGIPGLVARYLRGKKFVFEVRDLWPEGAVQLGLLKNPILKKLSYALEMRCYKAASAIITLSPGQQEDIERRTGFRNVVSIPNASDNLVFGMELHNPELPDYFSNKFVFTHAGTISVVNNIWLVAKTAKVLKKRGVDNIVLLLIGDGKQKDEIQEFITSEKLEDVIKIIGLMPKTEVVKYIQNSYFTLCPVEPVPIFDTCSPNKIFDSFAASVPVIQTTQGWIKKLLEDNVAGYSVPADDPEKFADILIESTKNPELRDKMCVNSKHLANTMFDRDLLAEKMRNVFSDVISNKMSK